MTSFRIASFLFFVFFMGQLNAQAIEGVFDKFDQLYQQELGTTQGCNEPELNTFRVCSQALRNEGNAPFILHHKQITKKVVVLFHGLSDSPFYFDSIANALHQQGHNVVVALLPGHGKKEADLDMQDYQLSDRWRIHVTKVMGMAEELGEQVYIGGFSTGGALATEYVLLNPELVKGLFLFSGAMALDSTVETLAGVWGIQWVLKLTDGKYDTDSQNPFKYPSVPRFTVIELMEVINSTRELIRQTNPNLPIFSAHSEADSTTPIHGVKALLDSNHNSSELFVIEKQLKVCHGDLVLNQQQVAKIGKDKSATDVAIECFGPKANPKHPDMLKALLRFMEKH